MIENWTEYKALLYANQRYFDGCLKIGVVNGNCFIHLNVDIELKKIELESTSNDFFCALINIRKELDKENFLLCCNGARKNFYPSNMSLQMSKGKVGYLLNFGERANHKSRTFDVCDSFELMSTVNSQADFFEKWKESI